MAVRDMKGAASLFLDAVPTFSSSELMSYEDLIFYTVITSTYGTIFKLFCPRKFVYVFKLFSSREA